ncbi:hypothetical protein Cfor_09360 [Coptotermes formosanus]|uniref:C-type lectin domain-containing protein n=1 Tax=Coptotermes formosanus TaxID=36987 RepID=A0A6L2Q5F6_COPFO|nr:hypothetical protein Cfor_09360 [Coptotermes formosanus]
MAARRGAARGAVSGHGLAPPQRPGQDIKQVPGLGYYKFHANAQTWLAARHTCTKERAHLLIVNSDDEFATVKSIWDNYPNLFQDWRNDYVHIGITDLAEEGNFTTMFGEPMNMTGYARWGNGEPSHGKAANCGRLSRTGQLFDSYCTNVLAFFCEQ